MPASLTPSSAWISTRLPWGVFSAVPVMAYSVPSGVAVLDGSTSTVGDGVMVSVGSCVGIGDRVRVSVGSRVGTGDRVPVSVGGPG